MRQIEATFAAGTLLVAVADGTATVTLNRVQVKNAVTLAMWQAMPALFARLGTDEALRIGFVDRVVASVDLEATTRAYLGDLAALAPLSQRASKGLVDALAAGRLAADGSIPEDLAGLLAACHGSADYAEGVRAFLEKRAPRFNGR